MAEEESGQPNTGGSSETGTDGQPGMDAADRAALDAEMQDVAGSALFTGPAGLAKEMADIARIADRANTKAELAQAISDNTRMVVDPDEVDALAGFFEEKASELEDRWLKISELANIPPPGTDPVSTGAASIHGQVASGDDRSYIPNYLKLAQVFNDTAASLRSSARQTRTDDANAADSFDRGIQNA
ncbi:hypothetical protein CDG81_10975 [Actinopolyspora erythraea]|uniref:PE domain-containing protein n=1 Tax=Actinopolyspora erythraea TaxID=414996 RepID=A0A223RS88_9ACTN|nr:hypothetical protein [Actinopolyspora erythraea]ASU78710.1 hypothetical protein CDG81_10975 [Actinopolyspora erythraea]